MGTVTVFAILCLGWCRADLLATPEYMVLGKFRYARGEIWRCPLEHPTTCELFHEGSDATVTDTLVYGEHLYASLYNGLILECNWYVEPQCQTFYRVDTSVHSLAAADGFLYAGDYGGNILRCQFNQPRSCSKVYRFNMSVASLYKYDNYIYAVTRDYLSKCSRGMQVNCTRLEKLNPLRRVPVENSVAVSAWGNSVITLSWRGEMRTYRSNNYAELNFNLLGYYNDMTIFKGKFYLVHESGDIQTCQWARDTPNNCTVFARHHDVSSISFVYRSHAQSVAPVARGLCGARSSVPVFEYGAEHRAQLEVGVVAGKLHDARGAVDTRAADAGYSGRAAIFAMAPDGQLLVSAAHGSGLVHITSLFAGAPVASAGEMHVEAGVVTRIVACSEQYRATIALNRQVVDELYSRGYTREIQLEECVYTCDRD